MRFAAVVVAGLVAAGLMVPAGPAEPMNAAKPTCKGRAVTILGTDGADHLRGTNHKDVILALGGDDRIDGRGGGDVICGGSGRDLIRGGPGADKIFAGADGRSPQRGDNGERLMVGDVVQGGPGDDLVDLGYDERQQTVGSVERDRLSYKDSRARVVVTLGGPDGRGTAQGDGKDLLVAHPFLTLLGSDHDDVLTGSPYGDQILGRGGDDALDGAGGRDILVDGPAGAVLDDDVLVGGIGRDELTSYAGHDRLEGDASADVLTVVKAPLNRLDMRGGPGADLFVLGDLGLADCPVVVGGGGVDELRPTVQQRLARGKADVDLRDGTFGLRRRDAACGFIDSVETLTLDNAYGAAQRVRWLVHGTAADETVTLTNGGSVFASMAGGDDQVVGSSGDDNLKGGSGDDRLFGGGGHDVADGGPGTDTCRRVEFKQRCEIPG
jgi:Ca2+-binding RTX toxin-like protein